MWERVLREYASLQRQAEPAVAALLAAGVPDQRPERLPALFESLVEDDRLWVLADGGARPRLRSLTPTVEAAARDLAAAGIPATIDHADLHGRNVLVGPPGDRIFDWGDAAVGHPFATMLPTLWSIVDHTGLPLDGPEVTALREAYTSAWSDRAEPPELAQLAGLAYDLGHLGRASAWQRAMAGLTPADMGDQGGGTAEWLVAFADRLERWAATR
jgi:hypothetical protein